MVCFVVWLLPEGHYQNEAFSEVRMVGNNWYGDVYYTNKHNNITQIAQSKTVENGLAETSFDSVFYVESKISPNGEWIVLRASCWEESCVEIYNIKNQRKYQTNIASTQVHWAKDSKLEIVGECKIPSALCGIYESKSVNKPWVLEKKEESTSKVFAEEDQGLITQRQTYTNENYSFEYPENYQIKEEIKPERIDVVGKNGKISIFQLKSSAGERVTELGFGGTNSENIPKKMKIIENEQTWFDVWLYYDASDKTTEEELLVIYESIELK